MPQAERIPREQLAEVAQVKRNVRQYLAELEEQNPSEEPVHEQSRSRRLTLTPPTPPKVALPPGWVTTTTIWSITPVV